MKEEKALLIVIGLYLVLLVLEVFLFDFDYFLLIDITVICIVFRTYFLCIGFVKRPIVFIEHKIKIEYFHVV